MDCPITHKQIKLLPETKEARNYFEQIWGYSSDPREVFLKSRRLGAFELPNMYADQQEILAIIESQVRRIMQKKVIIDDERFVKFINSIDDSVLQEEVIPNVVSIFYNALAKKENAKFRLADYHCLIKQQSQKIISKAMIDERLNGPILNAANEIEKFFGPIARFSAEHFIQKIVQNDFASLWQTFFYQNDSSHCDQIRFWLAKVTGMQYYIDNAVCANFTNEKNRTVNVVLFV